MEAPHTDLTEVTRVVLVEVGPVVVLATGHTTTTRVLAVLSDTTVTGRHMAAAVERQTGQYPKPSSHSYESLGRIAGNDAIAGRESCSTHCFLVFVKRVGILSAALGDSTRRSVELTMRCGRDGVACRWNSRPAVDVR